MNRAARRAKMAAPMMAAYNQLRTLHAANDWLGVRKALPGYWSAREAWRAV